jgi:methylenetetrahydrofolate dehydrogenase (NADP+) / methenyltetrahydrofolate cyclohydrolase
MIINGREIANDILSSLQRERPAFGQLRLGFLTAAGDAATESFVAIKGRVATRLGVEISRIELNSEATTSEASYAVAELVRNTDGVVIQLPLPQGIDLAPVLDALPKSHDIDALNDNPWVRPPVAAAIAEVLSRGNIAAAGKKAIVVGLGRLVGAPAKELLEELGAQVEVVTLEQGALAALQSADIVVLGAGSPGLVKPEMLKPGVVLIDAGTSDVSGVVVGDADPHCAEVASIFSPTPGGIGPIAVAMLYKNFFMLLKEKVSPK